MPGRSTPDGCGSLDSLTTSSVRATATTLTGRFTRKIQRQPKCAVSRPPAIGPAAAAALTYALIRGSWASAETIALLVVVVVSLVVFVAVERARRSPMLDLSLLRNVPFTALLAAGALLSAAAWASMTYESLWLQSVLGLSPIKAGLVLLPAALMAFAVSAAIGRVLHTTSPRLLIGAGLLVIAAGALAQSVIRAGSGWAVVIPGLALVGIGAGLAMAPLSATAMAAVPGSRAGMAAGAVSTFRQLGYAFGIAVLGQVFRGGLTRAAGNDLAGRLAGGQAQLVMGRSGALARQVHQAFADGLDQTFVVAAGIGVVAGVVVLVFVRPRQAPAGVAYDAEVSRPGGRAGLRAR